MITQTESLHEPLRIVSFSAKNTKRLKAITIRPDPDQNIVILSGKNRQGKSSIIDSIWFALGGKNAIPVKPIRSGESEAFVTLDLGAFIVERRFTESGSSYLDVKTKEGFKAGSPQNFLVSRLGNRAQNPLEFMNLKLEDQVKALQSMVRIKLDTALLGKISGLPMEGVRTDDPIMVLDAAYKHLYEERTKVNNEVKRLESVVKTVKSEIPEGLENTLPASTSELFEKQKAVQAQSDAFKAEHQKLRDIQAEHNQRMNEMSTLEKRIEETEKLLSDLRESKGRLKLRIDVLDVDYEAQTKVLAVLVEPDFSEVNAEIFAADETNKIAESVKKLREHAAELEGQKNSSADLTSKLAAIKEYKGKLIIEAGFPVEGLGFDFGEVTYRGIPLSQASGAEQIQISCAICAASHPEIRVLTIDVGWSELDSESKAALLEWAQKTKSQIWVTRVTDEPGEGGFWIEDGELKAVDGQMVESEVRAEEMEAAQ